MIGRSQKEAGRSLGHTSALDDIDGDVGVCSAACADCGSCSSRRASRVTPGVNQALRRELLQTDREDQKYRDQMSTLRNEATDSGNDRTAKELETLRRKQEQSDIKNLKRLEEIISQHGWPGQSLVGSDGSLAAFVILQHAELEAAEEVFPAVARAP